jgi:exosortase A
MTETNGIAMSGEESIARKPLHYHLAALSFLLVTISIAYFDTFLSMVDIWLRSETFLHGFIISPISVFLVWRKWAYLKSISPHSFAPGILILVVISAAWFVADAVGIQVGMQLAATAIIPATVLTVMGVPFTRAIAFPLGYLFFAVPFGEFWIPELQEVTADFAVGMLRLTGIPVLRDGLYLSTPSGDFEVAEACSGIRYLLATLALGTLYAHLNYQKTRKKMVFVAFSVVLPIVANGIRAYGIIAIAHFSDMKYAVGVDHIVYGWLFFAVVIGLMFLVGSRYHDAEPSDQDRLSIDISDTRSVRPIRLVSLGIAAVAATTFGPIASQTLETRSAQPPVLSNGLPNALAGWHGAVLRDSDWTPLFAGATQETLVRYVGSEAQVDVALIRYAGQSQGSELANAANSIFGGNGWKPRAAQMLPVDLVHERSVLVFETSATSRGTVRRFWYWYEVNGRTVTGNTEVKFYEAVSILKGDPAISSAIIVSVVDNGSERDALQQFMNDAYGAISECLAATVPLSNCGLGRIISENK